MPALDRDCLDLMTTQLMDVRRFGTTRAIVVCSHENVRHERAAGRRLAMLNVATECGLEHVTIL
jgi:hypothetical protein